MKQKVMLLLTCLFLSIGMVMAQSSKVTGRVLSAEDNEPIVGATVQIEGNQYWNSNRSGRKIHHQ